MTADSAVALAVLAGGIGAAGAVAWRLARSTGLGVAHPAVAWLVLHVVLFGAGSALLALGGSPAPAAWVGGALLAFALGAVGSASLARRRRDRPRAEPPHQARGAAAGRLPVIVALAVLAVLLVVPTLAATGIPFLVRDVTGARTELAGIVVQPLRIALPALAVVLVLRTRGEGATGRGGALLAAAVVVAIAGFELLLASRYLLAELVAALGLGWLLAGGRLPVRVVAVAVLAGAVAFGGIGLLRAWDQAAGRPLEFVAERTVSRVLLVQPRTMEALMRVIPAEEPHFLGLTWLRRAGPLVGRDDIPNLGYWIYPEVVRGAQATAGYAAPGVLGEAWANFGWAGLGLLALLGVGAERLGALASARRGSDADVAAAALLILFLARSHALGVLGLGVLVALVAGWRLLAAGDGGLRADVAAVLRWRPPPAGFARARPPIS